MSRPAVEYITWIDSVNTSGWFLQSEVPEALDADYCYSVGYVVGEDDIYVYMATTVNEDSCLAPISIPLDAIYKRLILVPAHEGEDE